MQRASKQHRVILHCMYVSVVCRDMLALQAYLPVHLTSSFSTLTKRVEKEDGKIEMAASTMRKGWWTRIAASDYPIMAKAAQRLLSAHASTAAAERNWSAWGRTFTSSRSQMKVSTAEKIIFINSNSDIGKQRRATGAHHAVSLDLFGMDSDDEELNGK